MDLAIVPLETGELAHERGPAERALRTWLNPKLVSPGEEIAQGNDARSRLDPTTSGGKHFKLRVPRNARFGICAQHLPSEFSLRLLQAGANVAPVSERDDGCARARRSHHIGGPAP
jgi:hypothetical protein